MDKPKAAEYFFPERIVCEFRYKNPFGITHDNMADIPVPVYQHPDLTSDRAGAVRYEFCNLCCQRSVFRYASSVYFLECFKITLF
jgi:hypothetical protein